MRLRKIFCQELKLSVRTINRHFIRGAVVQWQLRPSVYSYKPATRVHQSQHRSTAIDQKYHLLKQSLSTFGYPVQLFFSHLTFPSATGFTEEGSLQSLHSNTSPVCILYNRRFYSTNNTSVSPPLTPSTQSECLPASETHSPQDEIQVPEPPTNCCMSGCANCVWITYAQELAQLYKDSGKAAESVMNAVEDPSLKVFLNLELNDKLSSSDSED